MLSRLKLQTELEELLGSPNVYFQPPESIVIDYPAIIYKRARINNGFANNGVYGQVDGYQVIVLDADPDSEFVRKLSLMETANHQKHYTSNNLNYDVFTLSYNKL